MDERPTLPLDAETLNAYHDALGALIFALALEMRPEQRVALTRRLMGLAQSKTSSGAILAGTLLLDYALAAELAAKQ